MTTTLESAARNARKRAKLVGLRFVQRGKAFDLVDGSGAVVHTGDIATTARFLAEHCEHRRTGPPPTPTPPAWAPAIELFVTECRAARRRPGTISTRVSCLRTFAKSVPGSDPRTITRDDLIRYIGDPRFSPNYAHSTRSTFRVFFRILHEHGERDDDPAARLPEVRIPRSLPRPCPDGALQHAIRTATDPRVRLALQIATETGLRRAEIAGLKRSDVEGWPRAYSLRVFGKGGHERVVPISDELAAHLLRVETVHVFTSGDGHITPHYLGVLIARALPDKWTAHTIRHRFGTKAYQHSGDLRAVQELLGHNSPATTAIYTQVSDASRRIAAEAARMPGLAEGG